MKQGGPYSFSTAEPVKYHQILTNSSAATLALALLGILTPMCCAPGTAASGGGSKVSVNIEHAVKPAINCVSESDPTPDASCESKYDTNYSSDYVFKSEPESDTNYELRSKADFESNYESEAESEANYECDALDRQMHTPLESRSAPAAISMALHIKAEAQSALTGAAMLSSHHSLMPVSIKDQGTAAVQHTAGQGSAELQSMVANGQYTVMTAGVNVHQAGTAGSSDGQCINGLYSNEVLSHGQGAERKQETAQQAPAVITSQRSKHPRLSALISSLRNPMRGRTGSAAASSIAVEATSGGQAAAAAALASPPDSKPDCSSQCKPMQRLKKLVLKVRPSCMRTGTHSHQQEEDVQALPAVAAALQANQTQYAHQPQEVLEPKQAQDPQHVVLNSQLGVQPLPAAAGSRAKQPEKKGLGSRMPGLTKLALLSRKSTKDQQATRVGQQVQLDAMHVQTSTVLQQQQQQQQPTPAMIHDRKRCVSKLTGMFKPRTAASNQGLSGAAGSHAIPSLQEAVPAELISAVRHPDGVMQQAGPSPQLQVVPTAAAKPAIQVQSLHNPHRFVVKNAV